MKHMRISHLLPVANIKTSWVLFCFETLSRKIIGIGSARMTKSVITLIMPATSTSNP